MTRINVLHTRGAKETKQKERSRRSEAKVEEGEKDEEEWEGKKEKLRDGVNLRLDSPRTSILPSLPSRFLLL